MRLVVAALLCGAVLALVAGVAIQVFLHAECVAVQGSLGSGWICR